ncbi:hypothetical protein L9F63_010226, partial [Diploptera punctata]
KPVLSSACQCMVHKLSGQRITTSYRKKKVDLQAATSSLTVLNNHNTVSCVFMLTNLTSEIHFDVVNFIHVLYK